MHTWHPYTHSLCIVHTYSYFRSGPIGIRHHPWLIPSSLFKLLWHSLSTHYSFLSFYSLQFIITYSFVCIFKVCGHSWTRRPKESIIDMELALCLADISQWINLKMQRMLKWEATTKGLLSYHETTTLGQNHKSSKIQTMRVVLFFNLYSFRMQFWANLQPRENLNFKGMLTGSRV